MDDESDALRNLVLELFAVDGIKVRNVMLKSGLMSPIYIDLRVVVSYPSLLVCKNVSPGDAAKMPRNCSQRKLGGLLCQKVKKATSVKFESICGVPYTALPIATVCPPPLHCEYLIMDHRLCLCNLTFQWL